MMQRVLTQVPDVPTGAIFNPRRGFLSVVIPLERTNLVTNPSAEVATTDYTAVGGSIARSTTQSYHGAYSIAVTPSAGSNSDGVFYGSVSLTASTAYAYSCKFRGAAGKSYKISIATTGAVDLASVTFTATGRWQWVYGFWNETSSTSRRFYIRKNAHSDASVFYVDGLQIESMADGVLAPTTYIDGDQAGLLPNQFPPPYRWNGTPHASTSTRLVSTAAGGYVRNLDYYRYKVLAYVGLGLTAVANIAATSQADGAQYQTTVAQSRQFSVNGFWDSHTPYSLDQARAGLYEALGPDHASPRQPAVLFYQPFDGEEEAGAFGRIVASYQSGLEQTATPVPRENAPITFMQYLPGITIGEQGTTLTEFQTLGTINYILQRSRLGVWSAMGTGASGGQVITIAVAPSGLVYVGGEFTSMGGVANTAGIAVWNPVTGAWAAVGTGVTTGTVNVASIAIAPNGDVIAGGDFSTMGGVANTLRVARWNGSAWSALSTGANDNINTVAVGPTGNVYAGGIFTSIGGVAINRIAVWDGSSWATVGAGGADNSVADLEFGPGGILYAGGNFTTIGGVSASYVASWDGTTWTAMANTLDDQVQSLTIGSRGEVYAGGNFTGFVAEWNGTGWTTLGTLNNNVFRVHMGYDGLLRASGSFTSGDGITFLGSFATWNGSSWVQPEVAITGTETILAITQAPDGTLYVGHNQSQTHASAAVTTVTNTGTARAYPTFIIYGPSATFSNLYQFVNYSTGKAIYFNYTLNIGEVVYVRTSPHGVTFYSTFTGLLPSAILRGSSQDFALEKGVNYISTFTGKALASSPVIQWPITLQSASDLVAR